MRILRRITTRTRLGACLILALVVAACSGNVTRGPLTDLRMPGIRKIADLDALQLAYQIQDVAAYADPGTGKMRIIFQTDQLYTIGLDGRDLRTIKGAQCDYSPAITLDGRRIMCGNGSSSLHAFSLGSDNTAISGQSYGIHGEDLFEPEWSPDGTRFAVISRSSQLGCAIVLFPVATIRGIAQPIATLALPMFSRSSGYGCEVSRLAWSRDGVWLAIAGRELADGYDWGVYVLSLANIAQLTGATASAQANVTITPGDLTRIGDIHYFTPMAWSVHDGHQLLTFVEGRELAIMQVEPQSGLRTLLIQPPAPNISVGVDYGETCGLSWTPDDAHLVFVQCGLGNIEVHPTASKLYAYTPPLPDA